MMLLDGKAAQDAIKQKLAKEVQKRTRPPVLAIIQIGDRAESNAYIERKKKFGETIGVTVSVLRLQDDVAESVIEGHIQRLNQEIEVDGILLQLPIPKELDRTRLIDGILPAKDVDGLTSTQIASRGRGELRAVIPATARGVLELLTFYNIPISGKKIAVLGRSALVGTPTADVLRQNGGLVTVCHSKTPNTQEISLESDIIVVAIGRPKFLTHKYVRSDGTQTIVDVGINAVTETGEERLEDQVLLNSSDKAQGNKLVGDVDFEDVQSIVHSISPVPGGVGPMTVTALFENLLEISKKHQEY